MKSVLWRAAKLLSYIEDARCLKVNVMSLEAINFPEIWEPLQNSFDKGGCGGGGGGGVGCCEEGYVLMTHKY